VLTNPKYIGANIYNSRSFDRIVDSLVLQLELTASNCLCHRSQKIVEHERCALPPPLHIEVKSYGGLPDWTEDYTHSRKGTQRAWDQRYAHTGRGQSQGALMVSERRQHLTFV
jgi:hypothetical protein